jgi:hypothetical protein
VDITSWDSIGGILWNVSGSMDDAVAAVAEAIAAVVAARDDVVLEDATADEATAADVSDAGSPVPPAGLDDI